VKDLIDILDLTTDEIDELIDVPTDIIANPDNYREKCKYKKLATLFFEPSEGERSCNFISTAPPLILLQLQGERSS